MFCIEQYALAMALAQFLGDHHLGDDAVMLFERELILLQHDGRMSFDVVSKIPTHLSGGNILGVSNISGLSVISQLSGLNLSGLVLSGINLSGLNLSNLNISGGLKTNLSNLNLSNVNLSNLSGLLASSGYNLSGLNLSGLNLSGLNLSGINLSGLTTEEILKRLNLSGLNISSANLSGLTLSQLEKLLASGSVNLSGIDFKYLQQGAEMETGPQGLTLVDKFGNSFIHYYHQNFEPLKERTFTQSAFSELFNNEAQKLK